MKKMLIFIITILILPSIIAESYEQTAADVSPGVFAEGGYFFPSTVYIGTDTDPELTSNPAIYLGDDADSSIGVYYYGSNYQYPVMIISDYSSGYGIYANMRDEGTAIYGESNSESSTGMGGSVYGKATGTASGVYGVASGGGAGVYGYDSSGSGIGVRAYSSHYGFYASGADYGLYIPNADSYGVYVASSDSYGGKFKGDTYGVYGDGDAVGVYGMSDTIGVYGVTDSSSSYQCGVVGYNSDSGNLGYIGCPNYGLYTPDNAKVAGELIVEDGCTGCDIAEHFLGNDLEAGDVVVLDPTTFRSVKKTTEPYNKLAAGVVSTDPTIIMGIDDGVPIALSGVVPTKVIGKVKLGDLLTTSSTAGYAMACRDYQKCQGAIIGKAMEENNGGKGTITALVMLG